VETSSRKWQPIYFSIFSVTIVVTMVATVVLNGCSGCSRWLEWLEPIESATARGVLYATAIVSTIEVIRMVMLPADYLRQKFIEPLKERQKEEGREEGRTEGRAEMRAEFEAWLQRREEAEREGRDFNEPVPGTEGNSSADRNGSATKG
jgi:hypothetical protein